MTGSDETKDSESLISGLTNKKDDGKADRFSLVVHYKRELVKRQCKKFFLIPVTIVLAVIGLVTVTQDLSTYANNKRATESVFGGDVPLETNDPIHDLFDGTISKGQTRSIGFLSNLLGNEPHGGPKTIEKLMENVHDVTTPFSIEDVPFYWEVGGSGTIGDVLCKCLNINMASTLGHRQIGDPESLKSVSTEGNTCNIYNANMGTLQDTLRARQQGMMTEVIPDFITSPFLPEVVSMFTANKKARIITSIPNTKTRLNTSFGYLKQKGLFTGSLLEFVSSNHVLANNYLTHVLSGKWGGVEELTEEDLITAADILKRKIVAIRFADHRKIIEYLIQNKHWADDAQSALDCMYPPESPWSKESAAKPPPPPPQKTAEEIAVETAVAMHNRWDDRLFEIMNEQSAEQLGSIL